MSYQPGHIDGDQSAKTMDAGAKAGLGHTDLGDGIHENAKFGAEPAGEKTTGHGLSAFDKDGSVGKQFHADGAIGGTAQAIGGPFDKDGAVGKLFKTDGSVGGSVQEHLGGKK